VIAAALVLVAWLVVRQSAVRLLDTGSSELRSVAVVAVAAIAVAGYAGIRRLVVTR
jgi:hypothetical protein